MLQNQFPDIFSEADVAKFFGVSVRTLRNRRQAGDAPKAFRVGRTVMFRLSDVREYVEECAKQAA